MNLDVFLLALAAAVTAATYLMPMPDAADEDA